MRQSFIVMFALVACLIGPAGALAKSAPLEPVRIGLNVTTRDLTPGAKFTARVKSVFPAGASRRVRWSSSRPGVATVTRKGVVKAVRTGTTTITAASVSRPRVQGKIRVIVKKAAVVVDHELLGSWGLFTTGAGSIRTFNPDGTWTSAVRFEAPVGPLQVSSKGNYQARGGKIRSYNIVTRSRETDDDPWGPWKPAAVPERIESYVVGTDEYGEFLATEDSPGQITPDSVKYRRSE